MSDSKSGWTVEHLESVLARAKRVAEIRSEIGRLPTSRLKAALTEAVSAVENALERECQRGKPPNAPSDEGVTEIVVPRPDRRFFKYPDGNPYNKKPLS